jgi:hypothetical protein
MVGQADTMPGVTEPRPSVTCEGVTRRRLRPAGRWGLAAIAFEIAHVVEDTSSGVGAAAGLPPYTLDPQPSAP